MSLEKPQKNVPLTEGGEMMNVQTYALLQGFYEALTEPKTSIRMQSPDGNLWDLSISNAGAVVVTAA